MIDFLFLLTFSSLFRSVCSLFSNSLVAFEWFASFAEFFCLFQEVCLLVSIFLVSFKWFAFSFEIL